MTNAVMARAGLRKFGCDHASSSCRRLLKKDGNPSFFNLAPPRGSAEHNQFAPLKKAAIPAKRVPTSASFRHWRSRRSRGVVVAQKCGRQRTPSLRVFGGSRTFKARSRVLLFHIRAPNFAAVTLGRVVNENVPFARLQFT